MAISNTYISLPCELDGALKIYCYPYKIEINGELQECPNFPFILEKHAEFKVGNITHTGELQDLSISRKMRSKRSPVAEGRPKITEVLTNITSNMTSTLGIIKDKLRGVPANVNLTRAELDSILTMPLDIMSNGLEKLMEFLKSLGYSVGILAIGIFIIMVEARLRVFNITFTYTNPCEGIKKLAKNESYDKAAFETLQKRM